jgi:hypothetical protein
MQLIPQFGRGDTARIPKRSQFRIQPLHLSGGTLLGGHLVAVFRGLQRACAGGSPGHLFHLLFDAGDLLAQRTATHTDLADARLS